MLVPTVYGPAGAVAVIFRSAAAPVVVVMFAVVPELVPSSAVTVWIVPEVLLVVKATEATPEPFVLLVAEAKLPPAPVLDQVTTRPEVDTVLLFASASWALIVTAVPATGE